jgi:hypothetical protein
MNEITKNKLIFLFVIFLFILNVGISIYVEYMNLAIAHNPIYKASSIALSFICLFYIVTVIEE